MKKPIGHDAQLFAALLSEAAGIEPEIRRGAMFGSPTVFAGRKMVGCVFGKEIGLKVPADQAAAAIASGRATYFTPYGRPNMRGWIALSLEPDDIGSIADLLTTAIAFAKSRPARPE